MALRDRLAIDAAAVRDMLQEERHCAAEEDIHVNSRRRQRIHRLSILEEENNQLRAAIQQHRVMLEGLEREIRRNIEVYAKAQETHGDLYVRLRALRNGIASFRECLNRHTSRSRRESPNTEAAPDHGNGLGDIRAKLASFAERCELLEQSVAQMGAASTRGPSAPDARAPTQPHNASSTTAKTSRHVNSGIDESVFPVPTPPTTPAQPGTPGQQQKQQQQQQQRQQLLERLIDSIM
jgi:hypothetical protein